MRAYARHAWQKVKEPRFVSVVMFLIYTALTIGGIGMLSALQEVAQATRWSMRA